jgi:hypothetical protein
MLRDGRHQSVESAHGHQVWADFGIMSRRAECLLGPVWHGQFLGANSPVLPGSGALTA